ncbi:hypothetical protein ARMGADRAFT_946220 [Armillaria gallica]|uniref:P-loop containing nucleoside triphosphate hydrolase protein n=1 Tax=Armillaria gallica TaxID=47427 RepID=A0A2H3D2Q6_ARMGA|nr:hypothetical protein ARMGADRAFT_946220 [Armillaria gallica]
MTFMLFEAGYVRSATVDKLSSVLDSEGEFELFDNLFRAREGNSMIFVTSRFGHLTKRADLVLCMKHGKIAETGTREDLMAQEEEYAKLYNIEASTFTDNESS